MPSWLPSLPYEQRQRPPIRLSAVAQALTTQMRVIRALMLRESLSRYGDHKIGFLWAFIEPLLTVLVLVLIFSALRNDNPGGMPLIPFMLLGIVSFGMLRDPLGQMTGAISQNKSLLAFPQVTTFDVLVSRALMELAITAFVLTFMLSMAHLLGYHSSVENPLGVVAVLLLLGTIGTGVGFLFSSLEPIIPSIRQISSLLMGRPLFLGSGLFFTAESVPAHVRELLLYNPILHCMELLRSEYFYEFETHYGEWGYVTSWAFGSLAVGLAAHRALRRKVYAN